MKTKWVATLNAGKFNAVLQFLKNSGTVLLMSLLFLIISCDKSDDLDPIGNESPPDNESIIVYTDIEPDFTSENLNDSYNLDLNNDQIFDFTLISNSYDRWEFLQIDSYKNAANDLISVAPDPMGGSYPVPLGNGREIFNLRGYPNGVLYSSNGTFNIGCQFGLSNSCWLDQYENYLGLRFKINGQTHYGWARVDVVSASNWVIKDYAYNATPNKPILAGQKE